MMTKKELENRWTEKYIQKTSKLFIKKGEVESPFGVYEDKIDLRGFPLEEFIKGKTLESIDFSYMSRMVAGQIGLSKLKNCKFIAATVDTNLGDRFEYCDFTQAKMPQLS